MKRCSFRRALCIQTEMEIGKWKTCAILWRKVWILQMCHQTSCTASKSLPGILVYLIKCSKVAESTLCSVSNRETMAKSILTNGFSKASVNTWSPSSPSFLILEPDQTTMPYRSCTSIWFRTKRLVAYVEKLRLIFKQVFDLHVPAILCKLHSSTNTS